MRFEDNHQSSPQTLHQTIANMDLNAIVPYSPSDADMDFMDSIVDFEV